MHNGFHYCCLVAQSFILGISCFLHKVFHPSRKSLLQEAFTGSVETRFLKREMRLARYNDQEFANQKYSDSVIHLGQRAWHTTTALLLASLEICYALNLHC